MTLPAGKKPAFSWLYAIASGIPHCLALWALFHFSWTGFWVFFTTYIATMFSVTFNFHRYLTHKSFKMGKPLEYITATLATLSNQGGPMMWVAYHRLHHAFADTDRDPVDSHKGFWHAHFLWLAYPQAELTDMNYLKKFARDVMADKYLAFLSNPLVGVAMQPIMFVLLAVVWNWEVALWGVFMRLVFTFNATNFVNSIAHRWGYQTYETPDKSTNNWFVGLLALGEGWHNNHHAYERVAVHGHYWWEFDFTGMIINRFAQWGWIWDVHTLADARLAEAENEVRAA